MVIHTKEKAKIHSHEPKGARIKGSNIYTVERGPKIAGAKAAETMGKKSYRKSTVYQVNVKEKGLSRFKRNVRGPCQVSDEGFRCIVILPRGTNYPLTQEKPKGGDGRLLWAQDKWLIAHPDNKGVVERGAYPGLHGENFDIKY